MKNCQPKEQIASKKLSAYKSLDFRLTGVSAERLGGGREGWRFEPYLNARFTRSHFDAIFRILLSFLLIWLFVYVI